MLRPFLLLFTALLLVSSASAQPKAAPPKEQLVEISTGYGKIVVKLYNETPRHRDNFIKLVKQGFYDSLLFHRVMKSFMIQGGDPLSKHATATDSLGQGGTGYYIPSEVNPKLYHKRGALAAASDENPDMSSSGCQFYIVQGKTYTIAELNDMQNRMNYGRKYTLFEEIMHSDSVKARIDDYMLRGDKDGLHQYTADMQRIVDKRFAPYELRFTTTQMRVYSTYGGTPYLDGGYTVFGEVVSGMDVVDAIAAQAVGKYDRPLKDVRMKMRLLK